ncbi:MAG TPA: hypothetical protein VFA75_09465 [Nevskia sp.]|nr:hypothetical protein [Nevskia sp.]
MNDSIGVAATRTVVRVLATGVAATLTTVAAVGSWMGLAMAGASGGWAESGARRRRGRGA